MSDNLQKLIEAARLLGLTAEKTPGSRYRFTNNAGEQIHLASNMSKAIEYLVGLRPAAPTKEAAAPATAKSAAEPVAAATVAQFQGMKNGRDRADLLRLLVSSHGRRQVMADLGISAPTLDEQVRSVRLYEESAILRQLVDTGRLSWSQLVSKVSTRMKLGLQGQEKLAIEVAKPAPVTPL